MTTRSSKTVVKSRELRDLEALQQRQLWWIAPGKDEKDPNGKETARALTRSATAREISYVPNRWRNLCFWRETTGRPALSQLAYGMAKRPNSFVSYYSSFTWAGTKSRSIAQLCDIFTNRLLAHTTHVSFVPSEGDWAEVKESQQIEDWVEAGNDTLSYFQKRNILGQDALIYGTGFMYYTDDGFGNPDMRVVHPDCVLLSDPDDGNPYDVILRFWGRRTELLYQYRDNPEACEAIAKASSAYPAFYFGSSTLDCSDIVPYLIGYTRPMGKEPGRHVEVIGDYTLIDEEWNWPVPLEAWQFKPMGESWFGQGIPEQTLQIAQWVDGLLAIAQESEQRGGVGKWLIDENANVNADALGDAVAAAVTYLGKPPEYITPEGIGQWFLQHLQYLQGLLRSIVHVSEEAIKGEAPKEFTSGIALQTYSNIEDSSYLEAIGRLEEFDRRNAYQLIMLGKRLNCNFIRTGDRREIKWKELSFNPKFRLNDIQAFNTGRLSQTIAGKQQRLTEMYQNGLIDKRLFVKYQQTPDIPGLYSQLNADADDIQKQLDELVKSDEYIPPSPFQDFDFAIQAVETKMKRCDAQGYPQEVLDRLSMWRATVKNLQAQNNTPDTVPGSPANVPAPPAPGMSAPGLQPPAGLPQLAPVPPPSPLGAAPAPSLPVTANSFAPPQA